MRNSDCKRQKKMRAVTASIWMLTAMLTLKLREYIKLCLSYCSTTAVLLQSIYTLQHLFTLLHSIRLYLLMAYIYSLSILIILFFELFQLSLIFYFGYFNVWIMVFLMSFWSHICCLYGDAFKVERKELYILIDRSDRIEARGGQLIRFICDISQC